MNDLEGAARPTLTELIKGRSCRVEIEMTKAVAVWAAKTCLMAELVHPESNATPPEHYRWMFEQREPPPLMEIWVVPIRGEDWALRMEQVAVLYGDPSMIDDVVVQPCNAHSMTFGLGSVAFNVMATTNPAVPFPPLATITPLQAVRIWPEPAAFEWRPTRPLNDPAVWVLRDLFSLWIDDDDDALFGRMTDLQL